MISLLRAVSIPYLRENRWRLLLTLLGVVIGVQGMVAMAALSQSIVRSFEAGINAIAGDAELQIVGPDTGIPESLALEAQEVPGVAFATALVQGSFRMADEPSERIAVFGIDLLEQVGRRNPQFPPEHVHIKHQISFLNSLDSIALGSSFLERHSLEIGSVVRLITPRGIEPFTIRGSLDPVGPAKLYQGALGLLDLPNAQSRLLQPGFVQAVYVTVAPGHSADAVTTRLKARIGDRARVERTAVRGQQMGALLGSLRVALSLASFVTMIAAFFIIYSTVAISIEQRRRSIAITRALGFRRVTIVSMFLLESALLGVVGGSGGILGGYALARLSLRSAVQGIADNYIHVVPMNVTLPILETGLAVGLGLATCLLAAIVPALRAVREAPAGVLRASDGIRTERASPRALMAAAFAISASSVLLMIDPSFESSWAKTLWITAGHTLLIVGLSMLAPSVIRAVASTARLAAKRGPFPTDLAVEFFSRRPRRAAATASAIMVGYALVVVLGSVVHSLAATMNQWLEHAHGSDVLIGTPPSLTSGSFDGALAKQLAAIPGVDSTERYRGVLHVFENRPVVLIAFDQKNRPDRSPLALVTATPDAYERTADGRAVIVSEGFAFRFGYGVDDSIALDTATGRREFRIAGIARDYTFDLGSIFVDIDVYQELWNDTRLTRTNLWASEGADLEDIRRAASALVEHDPRIGVMTNAGFRKDIADRVRSLLAVLGSLQILACAISMLGVINLLWVATLDRRREIALLRSVGVTKNQVRHAIVFEALLLGLAGVALGAATGVISGFFMVTHSIRVDTGWTLDFTFPVGLAISTGVAIALVSATAGYIPGWRLTRAPVATALVVE